MSEMGKTPEKIPKMMPIPEGIKKLPYVNLRKRQIVFKVSDDDFLGRLDQIVAAKKKAGMGTSFSYELIRLARNGFYHELKGSDLDVEILKELFKIEKEIRGTDATPKRT